MIRYGSDLPDDAFLSLAARAWPREYDREAVAAALTRTVNTGAWDGERLVGSVRVLSDGYLFASVTEILVDPDYRRRGIGRELMERALAAAPSGKLFLGAQSQALAFFVAIGAVPGPSGRCCRGGCRDPRSSPRRAAPRLRASR